MNSLNWNKLFLSAGLLIFGAISTGTLTGCAGNATHSGPRLDDQENYVYYPDYGIYYSVDQRQYVYLEGDTWSRSASPSNIPVKVLNASRSVQMPFHDSPEDHNSEVLKKYPSVSVQRSTHTAPFWEDSTVLTKN